MPLMIERARPWKRAPSRPVMVGRTSTSFPSTFTFTFGVSARERLPFGPFTSILPFATVMVTPFGSSTGRLPTRDCFICSGRRLGGAPLGDFALLMRSPNLAEELSADALLARLTIGEAASVRGEDGDA